MRDIIKILLELSRWMYKKMLSIKGELIWTINKQVNIYIK